MGRPRLARASPLGTVRGLQDRAPVSSRPRSSPRTRGIRGGHMTTIEMIASFLGKELTRLRAPAPSFEIVRPAPMGEAGPGDVTFIGATARDPKALLSSTCASLIIADRRIAIDQAALADRGVRG